MRSPKGSKVVTYFLFILALLTIAMLPGCGGGGGSGSSNGGDGNNVGDSVSAVVGPSGAVLKTTSGNAQVTIPSGALSNNTSITVSQNSNNDALGGSLMNSGYTFSPEGLIFNTPVTVTLKYDPSALPSGANEANVEVAYELNGEWVALAGSTVDTTNHTVSAPTSHFSNYGPVYRDPLGHPEGSLNGVVVYSNDHGYPTPSSNPYYSASDPYYLSSSDIGPTNYVKGQPTGEEWQCVEYIRRYYLTVYNHDISLTNGTNNALDFWNTASERGLQQYKNGGPVKPQTGDIIVFEKDNSDGHVAIVNSVTTDKVYIAQQNWYLNAKDASAELNYNPATNYLSTFGNDSSAYKVIGWLRLASSPATTYSISGTVSGAVSSGVTVTLSGASSASAITDSNGNYSFTGLANGNYTVTPQLSGYTFSPTSQSITVNGANVTGENFTASSASTTTTYTETVLHSFPSTPTDGWDLPAGLIMDSGGNLYGTTEAGGAYGTYGTVFKLAPNGSGGYTETVLYSFGASSTCGWYPSGLIMDSGGNFYGTTSTGDTCASGTVFKLAPNGSGGYTESVLYSFAGWTDGDDPNGGLIMDAGGNLYGTTQNGGASNNGTVFRLDTSGNEIVLYRFAGGADGAKPSGLIMDGSGNLYGTTNGGGASNNGTVFKLAPNGNGGYMESVLYSFKGGTDGASPWAGLVMDASGNLYGTTGAGGGNSCSYGNDCGTAFKLAPNGSGGYTETVLCRFGATSTDGWGPSGRLIMDSGGNLYGTTQNGGAYNHGMVFKLDTGGNETVLYSFAGGPTDGSGPMGGVIMDSRGNLYGSTEVGGSYVYGTVFKLAP